MHFSIPHLLGTLLALGLATPATLPGGLPTETERPRGHPGDTTSLVISGQVVDSLMARPLTEVVIVLEGVETSALTNAEGRYVLHVPASHTNATELTVRAFFIGYAQGTTTVRPADQVDGVLTADFELRAIAVHLEGHAVTGTAIAAGRREVGAAVPLQARAGQVQPGAVGLQRARDAGHEREQYARIVENRFRSAVDAPLSTFSVDVDRASYSNVRRFLIGEHRLPPVDAVQIEEMVNYFPYRYERPTGGQPVAVTTELGIAPWAEGHQLLRIGVASEPIETDELPPANLVFLLDVSGSMASANKLPLVKQALRLLVGELRPKDRVSVVVYAGAAGVVLEPTPGDERAAILEALDRLEAGGSTAGGQGLRLAYDVARGSFVEGGNNRVILATDGDFNVGESSDAAMTRLVEERREEGTFLTILGFGTGNLQSTKMQEMAQNGNGNYAYIDGVLEAKKVLVAEMGGTLLTVAKDVKVQVEFNPARVRSYRLLGYENRLLADEDFNDDTRDAGEMGAGHTVTALYEIVPVGSSSSVRGGSVDPLRYRTPGAITRTEPSGELAFVKVRYKDPHGAESRLLSEPVSAEPSAQVSEDLRFASAVAGFGMLLRESEHRGSIHPQQVIELAESALGEDADGYRREFLTLVERYRLLVDGRWSEAGR